jgi:hypothetical protein
MSDIMLMMIANDTCWRCKLGVDKTLVEEWADGAINNLASYRSKKTLVVCSTKAMIVAKRPQDVVVQPKTAVVNIAFGILDQWLIEVSNCGVGLITLYFPRPNFRSLLMGSP